MIRADPRTINSVRALGGLILAAGWVAYALLGAGSIVFLTVMIILTMFVGAGVTIVFRRN